MRGVRSEERSLDGVYRDRFTKIDGRWLFEKRRYDALAAPGPDVKVFSFPHAAIV